MGKTAIQWTDRSSNPVKAIDTETGKRGWFCSHASPGCEHCYSEAMNRWRGNGLAYIAPNRKRAEFVLDRKELERLKRLRDPQRIFMADMTDLWHEDMPFSFIDAVFETVCECRGKHTFQFLTKRPARLLEWFEHARQEYPGWFSYAGRFDLWECWFGVSVEDQRRADERIPLLLQAPAKVRFLSAEPLLGPVNLRKLSGCAVPDCMGGCGPFGKPGGSGIHWVIVGGESGSKARPCDVAWVRSVVDQCQRAGTACFVKQLGKWIAGSEEGFLAHRYLLDDRATVFIPPLLMSRPQRPDNAVAFGLADQKGGDLQEWPEDLRVRQFPEVAHV